MAEAPQITSIALVASRTVFDERGHPYTVYQLRTTTASGTWTVEKRFSEFSDLANALSERHRNAQQNQLTADGITAVAPPDLPKNIRSAGWFGGNTLSAEFVARREKGLNGWLQGVLAAVPADDELLVNAIAPPRMRRSFASASPSQSHTAPATPTRQGPAAVPPSPMSSPGRSNAGGVDDLGDSRTPPRQQPIRYASPYAYKVPARAPLVWEVVWEAPAEAPPTAWVMEEPAVNLSSAPAAAVKGSAAGVLDAQEGGVEEK